MAIVAFSAALCHARTLYVDTNGTGDYNSIQAAVNDSNSGDTIILLPGTYTGPGNRDIRVISYSGATINIQSTDPCNPSIVDSTVIDCQRLGRGFMFLKAEASVLAGFTIINAKSPAPATSSALSGSAVSAIDSNLIIMNCIIKNSSGTASPFYGSNFMAIYDNNSYIRLEGCTIADNNAAGIYGQNSKADIINCSINNNTTGISFIGTGLYPGNPPIKNTVTVTDSLISQNNRAISCSQTKLTIQNSTITDNNTSSSVKGTAGITASYSNVFIKDCIISRNKSLYYISSTEPDAGGVNVGYSTLDINYCVISDNRANYTGGGITNYQGSAIIRNCQIINNTAGGYGKGGGIFTYYPKQLIIESCNIKNNKVNFHPEIAYNQYGGGICYYDGNVPVSIKKCSIVGNKAGEGGGIFAPYGSSASMDVNNCLIINNEAPYGGAVSAHCPSNFVNCTFFGNKSQTFSAGASGYNCILWDEVLGSSSSIYTFVYTDSRSILALGYPFLRNISVDPMFTFENDCHLLPGSPCIDAGTNAAPAGFEPFELSLLDYDGNPRVIDGDSDSNAVVDMGAFEFNSEISRLAISDSQFNFWCAKDGPKPQGHVLKIRNTTGGSINWEIMENCPWLSVSANQGTSTGVPSEVIISIDANQLDIGNYQADMLVSSTNASGSPQSVHITLQVGRLLSVPLSFYTIQSAVDEANNGDWVVVADGIYTGTGNRDIDFKGKAITVCSQNGSKNCIIDCNVNYSYHRGFIFKKGEKSDSVLDGFTIKDGLMERGGAIEVNGTPTIKNCIFYKNMALSKGGAIYVLGPPLYSWRSVLIENCSFIENSIRQAGSGGAIDSYSPLELKDCNFIKNSSGTNSYYGSFGGAVGVTGGSIKNCNFIENSSKIAGAISFYGSLNITDSAFIGNYASDSGAAIDGSGDVAFPIISNSIFAGNRCKQGVLNLFNTHSARILNCTFNGNISLSNYGILYLREYSIVKNCILSDYGKEIYGNPKVSFNDIKGGFAGNGNIDVDPCFIKNGYWADANDSNIILEPNNLKAVWVNGDYHLRLDSPCIDAGESNCVLVPFDFDGKPRIVDLSGNPKPLVDMGAYETQNTPPVANAGPDQIAYAWIDGFADVTLNGTGSSDEDGDALTYLWKWSIDGNDCNTNGVSPAIELPVGIHTIELIVNDGMADSQSSFVEVNVIPPIQGTLTIIPRILNNRLEQKNILAMLRLPVGINRSQIGINTPVMLYPGEIQSVRKFILGFSPVSIFTAFSTNELFNEITGIRPVQLYVVGQLKSGQYFYGADTIRIINPGRPKPKL